MKSRRLKGFVKAVHRRSKIVCGKLAVYNIDLLKHLLSKEVAGLAPNPDLIIPLNEQLLSFSRLYPEIYPLWIKCFNNAANIYQELKEDSLSVPGSFHASRFKTYLKRFSKPGSLLDIGCGPQFIPLYLEEVFFMDGYKVCAIEPIESIHPFPSYLTFAEFLPWNEGTFDNIVLATSLDHVFDLQKTLEEISRVLRKGGRLICWNGFVKGAIPYNPRDSTNKPLDEYHLFHFDEDWFEDLFVEDYVLLDKVRDNTNVFHCFMKK